MANTKVIIENVRCSYVFLQNPRQDKDPSKESKYSVQIIVPKDHPQVGQIKAAIKAAATEKFGESVSLKRLKKPLRDGDEERDQDEYQGAYFINANNKRKPGLLNRQGQEPDQDDLDNDCFSGAKFHVSINFYGFSVDGNKGIAAGLNNVMLRGGKEEDRLDGSVSAKSEFSEYVDDSNGSNNAPDNDNDLDDWDDDIPF